MQRDALINGNGAPDRLFMFAGAALVLLGAGIIVSNPQVRRYLGHLDINGVAQGAMPDVERFMKFRSM